MEPTRNTSEVWGAAKYAPWKGRVKKRSGLKNWWSHFILKGGLSSVQCSLGERGGSSRGGV